MFVSLGTKKKRTWSELVSLVLYTTFISRAFFGRDPYEIRGKCLPLRRKNKNQMLRTPAEWRNKLKTRYDDREAAALARAVCCEMLGQGIAGYVLNEPLPQDEAARQRAEDIENRLLRYEPLQYIQGQARFLGRDFHVEPGVLVPRPETEELVERMLAEVPAGGRILDVGTGSGCIAVTLALEVPGARVEAWDVSPEALSVARRNSRTLGAEVDFALRDVLAQEPDGAGRWDVIVSNPPYVTESERAEMEPNVLRYEPAGALFVPDEDPLRFYRCIGQLGRHCLTPGGRIYFEANRTFVQDTAKLLQAQGFDEVRTGRDLSGNDRFVMARQPMLR